MSGAAITKSSITWYIARKNAALILGFHTLVSCRTTLGRAGNPKLEFQRNSTRVDLQKHDSRRRLLNDGIAAIESSYHLDNFPRHLRRDDARRYDNLMVLVRLTYVGQAYFCQNAVRKDDKIEAMCRAPIT